MMVAENVDGNGVTGNKINDNGNVTMSIDNGHEDNGSDNNDGDSDGAMGSGATGYNNNDDVDGQ